MPRNTDRAPDELRLLNITPGIAPHAHGSVLIGAGNTQVICAAKIEEGVPRWMKEQGVTGGWITAEYSMLPYSTLTRKARDSARGKPDGRGTEIQRLIGRSLRAVVDLEALGPRTLWIDCDVLQADGGTRTAAITGGCIAVALACQAFGLDAVKNLVAAVSVGIVDGEALLDLDYQEDKTASVDLNVVLSDAGEFVEVQGSGEEATFSHDQLLAMLALGRAGAATLIDAQRETLEQVAASLAPADFE